VYILYFSGPKSYSGLSKNGHQDSAADYLLAFLKGILLGGINKYRELLKRPFCTLIIYLFKCFSVAFAKKITVHRIFLG